MNKNIKGLISNLGIFTIANFTTKILNFLILPLYTSFLTTEEYGTIDLVSTLIQLLFPIFTLAISDAVMRFGISEKDEQFQIFHIGINQVLIGIIPMFLVSFAYIFISKNYLLGFFLFFIYVVEGFNTLFSNFAKAIDKTKEMAIISTCISAVILGSNVLFVAILKIGIKGYFCSILVGNCIGLLMYIHFCDLVKYLKCIKINNDNNLKKKMLKYSIPLIPNAVFWWINSSLDRWTLTIISGVSIVGLYAVANKLPTIISTIGSIFSQAWNLSLLQTKKDEQKIFFEKTYSYYNDLMFCCTIGIITFCKIFAGFGFAGEFYIAWKLVPLLSAGVFYNSLNSVLGSLFTVNKDTRIIFSTTLIGSIFNCILNVPLTIIWNAYGAAIATLISYIAVYIIRTARIWKLYDIKTDIKGAIIKFLIILLMSCIAIGDSIWIIIYFICFVCCLIFVNKTLHLIKNKKILDK